MTKTRFTNIGATAFQHPTDIQAINTLKTVKGLDLVCHKMMELGYERAAYISLIGNAIRVTPRHFSRLDTLLQESSITLGMDSPQLFIENSDELNAYTSGSENPFIVLTSKVVETFSDDEIRVVIGHELGHIKCRHVVYTSAASFVKDFADHLSGATLGVSGLLSMGLELALFKWSRKAELSADRAALLVSQDLATCQQVFMKLLGFPPGIAKDMIVDEFVSQAGLYADLDSDILSKIYKILAGRKATHPDLVVRTKEIAEWAKSDAYSRLLTGDYSIAGAVPPQISASSEQAPTTSQQPVESTTLHEAKDAALSAVKGGLKGLFKR